MDTKTKILNAAETLFAEKGFTTTSLREITSAAEVNLAAVNYHFGSKKELIKALMKRYLDQLSPPLVESLKAVNEKTTAPTLLQVFDAFVEPLLSLNDFRDNGTSIFLQLLGRSYIDSQGFLRWFITTNYPGILDNFIGAVEKAYPDLTREDIFWRLHFTMGTVVFTMSSSAALIDIADNDFDTKVDVAGVIKRIIPYLASGVGAPIIKS
ncbi:TetR/AcrR family transcriptional regulator [Thalassotalea ponticola]|uniref:TetR/AcrR family transcriptional regulator n=1 Tax=Thalassotalea ponticola TaxID=1523392 RepID=UPI0025B2E4E2|nr:TetR/AcrR family transcriptional regulator [Thalassotalea ponticola]MDN3651274.1 TetR/AcrR family transcriptional regulator [Thalassotalea ponticola]